MPAKDTMAAYHCPTCHTITRVTKPDDAPYRPFCGRRCQLIDLHHWFEGDYKISDPLVPDQQLPDEDQPQQ